MVECTKIKFGQEENITKENRCKLGQKNLI